MTDENLTIYFVEDEPDLQEVLELSLSKLDNLNYKIMSNAEESLLEFQSKIPDIIVCDHYLENLSGLDLLKQIKKDFPEVRRFLLTGAVDNTVYQTAKNQNLAEKIFEKPLVIEDIIFEILGK